MLGRFYATWEFNAALTMSVQTKPPILGTDWHDISCHIYFLWFSYISEMHNFAFSNDTAETHGFGRCESSRFHVCDIYTPEA